MYRHMLRMGLTLLLLISLALPGVVMALPVHQEQMKIGETGHHNQHGDVQTDVCEDGSCEPVISMMCCNMIAGHCASVGVPANVIWNAAPCGFGQDDLSAAGDLLHNGESFEADPPPPRA